MQALSQLSYGPTMLEAEFYAAVKRSPSLFSEMPKKECMRKKTDHEKQKAPTEVRAVCLKLASPRGFEPRSPP